MRRQGRIALPGLLLAVTLLVASCGGSGGAKQDDGGSGARQQASQESARGAGETTGGMGEMTGMQGMGETTGGMSGMEMGSGETAPSQLVVNSEYTDERFIDMMVPHHMMAIRQAEIALENAEHPEIRQLSEEIIAAQREEIEELKSIKEEEFGTRQTPTMMDPERMANMGMTMPDELAMAEPFDRAFIDSMVPHHAAAIESASVAYKQSDNTEIREIARDIIDGQAQEIGQMIEWRQEWYPQS